MNSWLFSEATLAWNKAVLLFKNIQIDAVDDLQPDSLIQANDGFTSVHTINNPMQPKLNSVLEIIPPLAGGITFDGLHASQPIETAYLSEFSLQFAASFLLSSLVRYRPHTWQHAISRSITTTSPADDRSLALVEQFLDSVLSKFPKLEVHAIDSMRLE